MESGSREYFLATWFGYYPQVNERTLLQTLTSVLGGIGTHGELLLSEATETSIFPQDGAPRPTMVSSRLATQPSIGQPAQRLSRQRFSALAQGGNVRRCSDSGSCSGVSCRGCSRPPTCPKDKSPSLLRQGGACAMALHQMGC